ncbi:hypothetical protein RclHR1_04170013 [Rhizophagus clarus]|uniref:BTB domain-containing protein n=1 Tax=Rhizophagus clarus TaxID=94130 RepID=A0A2Z6RFF2_9GLOM|nr:hypothetical protein RclHR1_04170013 [Rhizophagus clarus]GES76402.1 hypothetical protein GLOIN_2v1878292 [Rhizophagus clarus]
MTSLFHSGLSKDFSLILNDADDYNVIIQVGENNDTKEFRAHSVILRARSQYFKSALSTEWITKKNNMIMFSKPNITPIVFDMVLKYIYTGELNFEDHLNEDIFGLLIASDELLLEELSEPVQDYLIKNRTTWIQENFGFIFHIVFKLSNSEVLQDFCLESICAHPQPFFTSEDFLSLDKDILYYLLERNYLQLDEVDAWDCLIKWGIEQTPGLGNLNNDRTKWNNEDYKSLKKTLDKFIPLIRFVDFSPTEYIDKIQPFKAIIPNHIYEEIEEFHIKGTLLKKITLPPRNRIESNIIKPKLISKIVDWIERKEGNTIFNNNDSSYKFDLIYQGSRDGISNESFRNKCNLQEPILFLIKCQNSPRIFGGYTPVGFYHYIDRREAYFYDQYIFSTNSFIFYFKEDDNTQDMILKRVNENFHRYTIYNNFYNEFYGLNFGDLDLCMGDNILSVATGDYNIYNIYGSDTYTIEDIEAFKVTKR